MKLCFSLSVCLQGQSLHFHGCSHCSLGHRCQFWNNLPSTGTHLSTPHPTPNLTIVHLTANLLIYFLKDSKLQWEGKVHYNTVMNLNGFKNHLRVETPRVWLPLPDGGNDVEDLVVGGKLPGNHMATGPFVAGRQECYG